MEYSIDHTERWVFVRKLQSLKDSDVCINILCVVTELNLN